MNRNILKRKDLIYPNLCYTIIGILFDVYNELGSGYKEKFYQKSIALAFKKNGVNFKEQVLVDLKFDNMKIGSYYLDFIIEDKLVLEIKRGEKFLKGNIDQLYGYLKSTGLKLGLLVNFTKDGIKFKRIVNIK